MDENKDKNTENIRNEVTETAQTETGKKLSVAWEIFSWVKVIGAAVIISLFINYVVIVNAEVPSGSMRETIPEPSRLVAFRLSYLFSEPNRFDVVVFRFPDDESVLYVKRIIGMPGERVDIVNGRIYIDDSDTPLEEGFLLEPPLPTNRTFLVPENSYLVLGDNRNDSHDSRSWINSYLPMENILGRAIFTYFPSFKIIR